MFQKKQPTIMIRKRMKKTYSHQSKFLYDRCHFYGVQELVMLFHYENFNLNIAKTNRIS